MQLQMSRASGLTSPGFFLGEPLPSLRAEQSRLPRVPYSNQVALEVSFETQNLQTLCSSRLQKYINRQVQVMSF